MLSKRHHAKVLGEAARRGGVSCELLERRFLLQGVPGAGATAQPMFVAAHAPVNGLPFNSGTPPSGATTPSQMRHFYGVDAVNFNGIVGDGTGETIAIVDTYDDPNAASDLQHFDAFYGLPAPPSFLQYNQSGQLLPESGGTGVTPSKGKRNNGWQIEESLDIEWAHVIAPAAKIDLIECNSALFTDLYAGVSAGAALPNVVCVSMSWGGNEFSGESSNDGMFAASGVTYLAATGDGGESKTSYPAASVNVVAVGGTSISFASGTSDGTYGSETAWSGTGGQISPYEPKPSYQNGVLGGSQRGTPDVSMDADPNTGVAIYDSYDFGTSTPWAQYGGTSLSTPMCAALIAITDQGRASASLAPLSGASQTLPKLYSAAASNFHDVTSGSNGPGNFAAIGYDTVTGIGTPSASTLLNTLSGVPSGAGHLAFTQPPTATAAGSAIDSPGGVQVAIQNPMGVTVTTDSSTVTLQLNGGTFAGGSNTVMAAATHGVATFSNLVIDAAGSYTLTAGDGAMSPVTTASFNINPAASNALSFGVPPAASTTAGNAISPAVAVDVQDSFGNLVTTDSSTVTLTLAGGTFSNGMSTATAPVMSGVASFGGLIIEATGSYMLTASDGSLKPITSASFNVSAATSWMLVLGVGPSAAIAGAAINPAIIVDVEDAFGNLVTTDSSTVTLTLSSGTFSSGSAMATAPVQAGVANFGGLIINNAGSYTLTASDGSLKPAVSATFSISLQDVINSTTASAVTLRQDPDAQHIDWIDGNLAGAIPINDPNGLTINGDSGTDAIALDYTNGNPLPNVLHLGGTFVINTLQGANPLAGVTLEIARSTVYISYGSSDPMAAVLGYLRNGYNNGAWNGTPSPTTGAITSSAAAGNSTRTTAIGYADSADGQGINMMPNTIELTYTLYGDANLDHQVNSADLQMLLFSLNRPGTWDQGDFNDDGQVNSADLQMLLSTLNTSLGSQTAPAAAVPAGTSTARPTSTSGQSSSDSGTELIAVSTPASTISPRLHTRSRIGHH